ncbi:MAG: hypothetical protein H6835_19680, partial [Planctomycetes bacterium]|nr:hypothetical protein [Planctomycetota bacterium]
MVVGTPVVADDLATAIKELTQHPEFVRARAAAAAQQRRLATNGWSLTIPPPMPFAHDAVFVQPAAAVVAAPTAPSVQVQQGVASANAPTATSSEMVTTSPPAAPSPMAAPQLPSNKRSVRFADGGRGDQADSSLFVTLRGVLAHVAGDVHPAAAAVGVATVAAQPQQRPPERRWPLRARVLAHGACGSRVPINATLDSGAVVNLIDAKLADQLAAETLHGAPLPSLAAFDGTPGPTAPVSLVQLHVELGGALLALRALVLPAFPLGLLIGTESLLGDGSGFQMVQLGRDAARVRVANGRWVLATASDTADEHWHGAQLDDEADADGGTVPYVALAGQPARFDWTGRPYGAAARRQRHWLPSPRLPSMPMAVASVLCDNGELLLYNSHESSSAASLVLSAEVVPGKMLEVTIGGDAEQLCKVMAPLVELGERGAVAERNADGNDAV